jgi:hypothetical protein
MINEKVKKNQKTGLHGPVLVYFIPMTTKQTLQDRVRFEGVSIGRSYVKMVEEGIAPLMLEDWVRVQSGSIMDSISDDRLNVTKTLSSVESHARSYIRARTQDPEFAAQLDRVNRMRATGNHKQ